MFVDFVQVKGITGESLAAAILHVHGLSACNMRGQCYDGASNMLDQVARPLPLFNKRHLRQSMFTVVHID